MVHSGLLLFLLSGLVDAGVQPWLSPEYKYFFQFPLPKPQIKPVTKTFVLNGNPIDYYEVEIKPLEQQLYPNLGKTQLIGYDGMVPGPTFMMERGREAIVRFVNHGIRNSSIHLHGSYSRTPFDGWAEDTTDVGQYKDYYYPNAQNARTLWYHDHAIDHTAENAYFGQAGFYILHDSEEKAVKGLPQGEYDIPLALASRRYNRDGTLWDPELNHETVSVFGDVFHVNGQPWPYLAVEPRKYRFRFLDASVSRSFQMYLVADLANTTRLPFTVVGSDAGLLQLPVTTTQLDISMAERWEVVMDFSPYAGKNLTLRNNRQVAADDDFPGTDRIMRFVVANQTNGIDQRWDNETLPEILRSVPYPPPAKVGQLDHRFEFARHNGLWEVNGVKWSDGPTQRVLAKPQRGALEVWELVNSGGGWSHPVHIHLIDFQIIERKGQRGPVLPYEQVALKDVVWLNVGESVKVIARYAPWDGLYMFHCHNLIHEDNEMMVSFNVTELADLGYSEKTRFLDPMDPEYRSKSFSDVDFFYRTGPFSDISIQERANNLTKTEAYKHVDEVESKLREYWSTKTTSAASTISKTPFVTTAASSTNPTNGGASASSQSTSTARTSTK